MTPAREMLCIHRDDTVPTPKISIGDYKVDAHDIDLLCITEIVFACSEAALRRDPGRDDSVQERNKQLMVAGQGDASSAGAIEDIEPAAILLLKI
jgi:hypothetical protein